MVHDAFEMIVVRGRVVGALVHAEHEGRDVGAGGGGRDDDLLRAGRDVLVGVLGLGEAAGRLDDDVDAELAPRAAPPGRALRRP